MSSIKTLITILLVAAGILTLKYLVQPAWIEAQALQGEIVVVNDAIDKTKEVIRVYDDLVSRYDNISPENIERITNFLPSKPAVPDLLIDTDIMVANAGLSDSNLTVQDGSGASTAPVPGVETVNMTLAVGGSYESLHSLLNILEKNLRLIDITGISFTAPQKEEDFKFNLLGRTYYQTKGIFN
ncbi:MAG: hypothetical protein A3C84_01025 [Candidatus Ryanbacteria bacterium RIFCSPHIGHO2_02_FULL_48_12]|uniref:Uncharacterized protein n=1 Tax=Candidatus Ryanbacteria bacterium RIFCSPHIGHO2_01_FULL_48_27 TaxID=1802115 RepID=A0A1G2G4Y6_9BACT|nr:MAG: hypothetical protein A2756_03535 [Candidatus Ryanbacteria bacterium RIFCSPHIGHO2_01_FULL_48_27]OGZ50702.1 MAG: hypothetical protein A3C84_01025 [Candidatus Ryanbacteria bacterium RIFCSPHIGHO2_02_FULL_48_12]